ncbi:hypothetical protein HYW84_00155 [Candidatus Peregrinibacteria bacterium]|nr:hypothetical protein [Candidatus Peregrinibacteria bacterium]
MTLFALLFTLAAIGISETSYLVRIRRANENPVCLGGENCQIVLRSKYSRLFLVKNDVLGFAYYLVIALILGLSVSGTRPLSLWVPMIAFLLISGSIMSLFLTYLQWRVIRAWCVWCLISAGTIWLMSLLFLIHSLFFPSLL